MNNLILYAIVIVIIYHLFFIPVLLTPKGFGAYGDGAGKTKESYSDEENKLIEEGIKAYKDYEKETDPIKKKQKGEILSQTYDALLRVNPNIFNNGIPDYIKSRMTK
jgi:hypothetical protein